MADFCILHIENPAGNIFLLIPLRGFIVATGAFKTPLLWKGGVDV